MNRENYTAGVYLHRVAARSQVNIYTYTWLATVRFSRSLYLQTLCGTEVKRGLGAYVYVSIHTAHTGREREREREQRDCSSSSTTSGILRAWINLVLPTVSSRAAGDKFDTWQTAQRKKLALTLYTYQVSLGRVYIYTYTYSPPGVLILPACLPACLLARASALSEVYLVIKLRDVNASEGERERERRERRAPRLGPAWDRNLIRRGDARDARKWNYRRARALWARNSGLIKAILRANAQWQPSRPVRERERETELRGKNRAAAIAERLQREIAARARSFFEAQWGRRRRRRAQGELSRRLRV